MNRRQRSDRYNRHRHSNHVFRGGGVVLQSPEQRRVLD